MALGGAGAGARRAPIVGVPDLFAQLRELLADRQVATGLLAVGLAGLAIELALPGLFVPAIVGAIALVLAFVGFVQLPDTPPIVFATAGALTALVLLVAHAALSVRRAAVRTGAQALLGQAGVATTAVAPSGTVSVDGEAWTARVDGEPVAPGEPVRVVGVEGVTLRVTRLAIAGPDPRSAR